MALIKCPECSINVSDKASSCPACGYPLSQTQARTTKSLSEIFAEETPKTTVITLAKSRGIYIILGLLFGGLGFHNFYSGHARRGTAKLLALFVVFLIDAFTGFHSAFVVVMAIILGVWSLFEICTVTVDADGNKMS